jgi:hypothetical protein
LFCCACIGAHGAGNAPQWNHYIHEIGHNLGLDHDDKPKIMDNTRQTIYESQIGGNTTTYSYPSIDKKGIQNND